MAIIHLAQYQEGVYWKDLKEELFKIVNKWKENIYITPDEYTKIQNRIKLFCKQGTGQERTIYKFIEFQLQVHINNQQNKEAYECFSQRISLLCEYINNYLSKHPKKKKTIKSINDLSDWYWNNYMLQNIF